MKLNTGFRCFSLEPLHGRLSFEKFFLKILPGFRARNLGFSYHGAASVAPFYLLCKFVFHSPPALSDHSTHEVALAGVFTAT